MASRTRPYIAYDRNGGRHLLRLTADPQPSDPYVVDGSTAQPASPNTGRTFPGYTYRFDQVFRYVVGPFRTLRGAQYMLSYGHPSNPHLAHVEDAERYALAEARRA